MRDEEENPAFHITTMVTIKAIKQQNGLSKPVTINLTLDDNNTVQIVKYSTKKDVNILKDIERAMEKSKLIRHIEHVMQIDDQPLCRQSSLERATKPGSNLEDRAQQRNMRLK